MSKARDLADIVAAGSPLVDGTIETTDITNVTASATELNYVDGVTSNVQTQLDTKAPLASPTFTGTAVIPTASVTNLNLGGAAITATATELNLLDGVTATTTELNYVDGVTSAVQTQLDAKMTPTYTGDVTVTGVTFSDSLQEDYTSLSGTTPSIDADTAGSFALTTSGNTTFTFASVTSGRSVGFVLKLTAGGTHTITWPSSVDWAGGTAPDAPASGETDVLVFYTVDGGTNWYGFTAGQALG